jgi:acyl-CoA thioester hydrolase
VADPHVVRVQMRFADTDAAGHLNNARFAEYAELARLEFLRAAGVSIEGFILAHLAIDFRRQVLFGQEVRVETVVEKLGTTSVSLSHTMYANDEVAAMMRDVVVRFDYEAQRPIAIDGALRAAFERWGVQR